MSGAFIWAEAPVTASKREWLAAVVLHGLLVSGGNEATVHQIVNEYPSLAVRVADALIAELNKEHSDEGPNDRRP